MKKIIKEENWNLILEIWIQIKKAILGYVKKLDLKDLLWFFLLLFGIELNPSPKDLDIV